jgi:hypothetical protein
MKDTVSFGQRLINKILVVAGRVSRALITPKRLSERLNESARQATLD